MFTKTNEEYELFDDNQKGGPLFFILMIGNLLSNTREAAKSLEYKITNYKLTEQKGEDVSVAVSHLRGAMNRLIHIKQYKINNEAHKEFFLDMYSKLLKVFQTTSVKEFNDIFAQFARQEELSQLMKTAGTVVPTPKFEVLFKMAEAKYQEMLERDEWSGISNSGTESVFFSGTRTCFNCLSKDHMLDQCPKPKDQDRIKANKKIFFDSKKQGDNKKNSKGKGKPKTGKFAPPSEAEKNRRIIDGKPMYFLTKVKRWVDDRNPPEATKTLLASLTSDKIDTGDNSTVATTITNDDNNNSKQQLQSANVNLTIKNSLLALAAQLE